MNAIFIFLLFGCDQFAASYAVGDLDQLLNCVAPNGHRSCQLIRGNNEWFPQLRFRAGCTSCAVRIGQRKLSIRTWAWMRSAKLLNRTQGRQLKWNFSGSPRNLVAKKKEKIENRCWAYCAEMNCATENVNLVAAIGIGSTAATWRRQTEKIGTRNGKENLFLSRQQTDFIAYPLCKFLDYLRTTFSVKIHAS